MDAEDKKLANRAKRVKPNVKFKELVEKAGTGYVQDLMGLENSSVNKLKDDPEIRSAYENLALMALARLEKPKTMLVEVPADKADLLISYLGLLGANYQTLEI